ncbi:hypothetical protein BpHYR1_045187 [Brachionus plicatilis]|uniref:Uncharacterized protein n=1 Tax=Brachionus plicatilis TaxID=10195 RepID=A0A3M7SC73_BRAPC|nr:hypothetical protein BpHYR1_045187 [Brachionus plicatilis]
MPKIILLTLNGLIATNSNTTIPKEVQLYNYTQQKGRLMIQTMNFADLKLVQTTKIDHNFKLPQNIDLINEEKTFSLKKL